MNTSIPLQSVRPHIMTPEEGLKLQDLSMQVQQEQDKVQRAAQVRQIVQEPGMFDEAGIPTTMGIQKIMSADTQLGTHFLTARGMALDQQRKMETAKLVAESKKAAIAAKEQNDQALADSRRTKAQKEQYGLFQKITTDIDEAALSAYDASVKRGEPHEESVRKMRQARVDAFEERVNSGIARSAGFNDQMIETARSKMAGDFDPDEIRERVKTKKMREQEQKAELDTYGARRKKTEGSPGAAFGQMISSPGDGWQGDPKHPGMFIRTGGEATAEGGTEKTPVKLDPKQIPKGWTENPWMPGRIMPMPGGPNDPSKGGGKGAKTPLGKIYDDFRDGKISENEAQILSGNLLTKAGMPKGEVWAGDRTSGEAYLEEVRQNDPDRARLLEGILKNQVSIADVGLKRGQGAQLLEDLLRINPGWKNPGKGASAMKGSSFPPGVAENIAKRVWAGDRQATIGWARNPQMHAELERAIMEEGRKQGKNPKDLVAAMVTLEGERSGSKTLGTRTANVEVAINELKEFIPIAQSASDKVPRTGFKPINQLMRLGREQWSPEQAAFEAANRSIINAFAQVASRSGNATVHNTQEAEHMLNTAQTPEQYKQVLEQLMREAQGASRATRRSRKELSDEISGKESGPPAGGARASPPSSPTAPAGGTGPKRDKPITATNPKTGERLMLKDGQWVPLQ